MRTRLFLPLMLALTCSVASAQVSFRCTAEEKRVYDQHPQEIFDKTMYRAAEACEQIYQKYYVPEAKHAQIEQYVRNREFHKICLEYTMPDSLKERVRWKIRLDEHYQDSIDRVLIPEHVNKVSGDNISLALHLDKQLRLDSAQYEYMLTKALDMTRRIRRNRTLNVWSEEMDILRQTLSKEQLNTFFNNKNAIKVTRDAKQAWQRICEAGLEAEVDSVREMNYVISYYNEWHKIDDLYRSHSSSRKKYLAELAKKMPPMLRMLDALDKKKKVDADDNLGKEFVW